MPRIPPAFFVRDLFCVGGPGLRSHRCPDSPVHFDVLAHHPYPIGPPWRHAPNPGDVVVPDYYKLEAPLAAGLRAGKIAPRGHKQLWATEISWDTRPPDPDGIPAQLQARYLEGALFTLWSEGVDAVVWFQFRDSPPIPSYASTLQAGIFYRGQTVAADSPKPSHQAFGFPFTAYLHRGVAQLWGLAPRPGPLTVQVRRRNRWRTLSRLRASPTRLFVRRARVKSGAILRALQGRSASLPWRVFTPR